MNTNLKDLYPQCPKCDSVMQPIYFIDEEEIIRNGIRYKTGRTRKAVSHFECPICSDRECVDDSFDEPWH